MSVVAKARLELLGQSKIGDSAAASIHFFSHNVVFCECFMSGASSSEGTAGMSTQFAGDDCLAPVETTSRLACQTENSCSWCCTSVYQV